MSSPYTFTLTTACFQSNNYAHVAKTLADTLHATNALMEIPVNLVIYGDSETIPLLKEKRAYYGHTDKTVFRQIEKCDIWTFQYIDQVRENRQRYFPSANERHNEEIHLIQSNKAQFVLETIETNPFSTTHFGWTDAFLGKDTVRYAENYHIDMLPQLFAEIQDEKFHIQVSYVTDKKYKDPEKKREYYSQYQWVVCGGLYICGAEVGKRVLNRVNEIFVRTTNMGYGHGEEMYYLEILDEFEDDIVRSYGDYGQIWNNVKWPKRNLHFTYWLIFKRYQELGYDKEMFCYSRAVYEMMVDKACTLGKLRIDEEVTASFDLPFDMFLHIAREYKRTAVMFGHTTVDLDPLLDAYNSYV